LKTRSYILRLVVLFPLIAGLCASARGQDAKITPLPNPANPTDKPAAMVNGRAISQAELEAKAQGRLISLKTQEYSLKRQALDDAVDQILLEQEAARRGVSLGKLLQSEIEEKIRPVTSEQAQAVYESTRDRYSGKTEAEALALVESNLRQVRMSLKRSELLKHLRDQSTLVIYLDAPRQDVSAEDTRAKGPRNAPVTIVEFAEFQCPFCAQGAGTVKQLEEKYGDKIRVVFRDFPLVGFHQYASKSAEAGSCANEQGKFWEMYDKLFANQSNLKVPDLKQYAAELKLDVGQFNQCLDSGKYAKTWQQDTDEGSQYGVTGTPTFFVNGRMLVGNVPLDKFSQVIDEELQRNRAAGASASAAPAQATQAAIQLK